MRVLVACEYSGIVRDAFLALGHDAWSADLLPSEGCDAYNSRHFTGDVFEFVRGVAPFDLLVGHPPCTRLTNAGVRWLAERDLWDEMREGAEFFNRLRSLPIRRKALENPVMHGHARALCGPHSQTFQPWHHGEKQFKRICLWLDELPALKHSNVLTPPKRGTDEHKAWSQVHRCPPGPMRAKLRSRFFPGVAAAMAAQWGSLT